jgi:hypothetical protein
MIDLIMGQAQKAKGYNKPSLGDVSLFKTTCGPSRKAHKRIAVAIKTQENL